jgi:prepilin-type processing-associated H-X9-DG protein
MKKFTFIELLIVVSILAMLAGILIPSLLEAKRKTKVSLCANNQRLISIALSSYVSNSGTYLPQHNSWGTLIGGKGLIPGDNHLNRPLNPYVAEFIEVAICPSDKGDSFFSRENSLVHNKVFINRGTSYLPQWGVTNFATVKVTDAFKPPGIYSFETPDKKLFMADWIWHMNRVMTDKRSQWHSRERRLCNTLFIDGHVKLYEFPVILDRKTPPNLNSFGWY